MMGWRNLAFSAMDDATAKIQEAREALRDRKGTPEDFVLALLAATQTLNEAITCAVEDGVPNLCKPNPAPSLMAGTPPPGAAPHLRGCGIEAPGCVKDCPHFDPIFDT